MTQFLLQNPNFCSTKHIFIPQSLSKSTLWWKACHKNPLAFLLLLSVKVFNSTVILSKNRQDDGAEKSGRSRLSDELFFKKIFFFWWEKSFHHQFSYCCCCFDDELISLLCFFGCLSCYPSLYVHKLWKKFFTALNMKKISLST